MELRELARRESNGIVVRLLWNAEIDEVRVEYTHEGQGIAYTIYPPPDQALDAFEHPNAYASRERLGTGPRKNARVGAS